jgi:hypothetical protein
VNTITNDTIGFLPIDMLQALVLKAIDRQASEEYCGDPLKAAQEARNRKMTVLTAMHDLHNYPQDQRAILLGFWTFFGGNN